MRIIGWRPAPPGGAALAYFDLELTPEIRIYDLAIRRTPADWLMIHPPTGRRTHAAAITFAPALIASIRDLATAHMEGGMKPDERAAAA
jgi:hypothetical protein